MAPKILVVLTSVGQIPGTDKKTGWYLPEFAHPYEVLSHRYDIVVASPKGGLAPLDPDSVEAWSKDVPSAALLENKGVWEKTLPLADLVGRADEFEAVFYPGGHGPMFDLAADDVSMKLIDEFWSKGKVVAAVCHGPAALVNVKTATGESLLGGKTVTGFSNAEEDTMQMSRLMPFMLQDRLDEVSGSRYVKAEKPFAEKVVVDGNLITGQNPASSKAVGEAILQALRR